MGIFARYVLTVIVATGFVLACEKADQKSVRERRHLSQQTLAWEPLTVLGIAVEINIAGVAFLPEAEKVKKWKDQIQNALDKGSLCGGEASSLAGEIRA